MALLNVSSDSARIWTDREKDITRATVGDSLWFTVENHRLLTDLKKALQEKDEFISVCSHELKTTVTSLKLQYQMAQSRLVEMKKKFLKGSR